MLSNGHIELADAGVVISPAFSEQVFLASPLSAGSTHLVHNGHYRSYNVGRRSVGGSLFIVSLFFEFGSLRSVHFSPIDESVSSLADITDAVLERQTQENREWVERHLGKEPPLSFDWGTIETPCDTRSLSAMVVVRYTAAP